MDAALNHQRQLRILSSRLARIIHGIRRKVEASQRWRMPPLSASTSPLELTPLMSLTEIEPVAFGEKCDRSKSFEVQI